MKQVLFIQALPTTKFDKISFAPMFGSQNCICWFVSFHVAESFAKLLLCLGRWCVQFLCLVFVWGCGVCDSSLGIMRLVTIDDCEEGHESEDTLDTKQLDSISKLNDPLANIEARMERLKNPLLERDFAYFMQIGLNGSRINHHQLKANQDVVHEKLMETFRKVIPHLGFCYTKCWDLEMKTKVKKN